jgi:hypothetical protein
LPHGARHAVRLPAYVGAGRPGAPHSRTTREHAGRPPQR